MLTNAGWFPALNPLRDHDVDLREAGKAGRQTGEHYAGGFPADLRSHHPIDEGERTERSRRAVEHGRRHRAPACNVKNQNRAGGLRRGRRVWSQILVQCRRAQSDGRALV